MEVQERISRIEQTLAGLEQQIKELKHELSDLKRPSEVAGSVPQETADTLSPVSVPETHSEQTASASFAEQAAPTPKKTVTPTPKKEKNTSRFEENLGGKVMGIVAAVLIFVGLFLFGSMLYERLGDTARVTILFLISFLLLAGGLFFEHKHPSRFTASVVGCGFGAVYISLFLTVLYYELLTTEMLYILLLFWLTGIGLYVFRKQSRTVALLGQLGITFSVILGSFGTESKGQFTFLCAFFTILSLLYLWLVLWRFLPNSKEKPYPWLHLTAAGLNLIQLCFLTAAYRSVFGSYGVIGGRNWIAGLLLCLYCLVLPLFFLLRCRVLAGLALFPWQPHTRNIDATTFSVYKCGIGSVFFFTVCQIMTWIVFSAIGSILFEADVPCGLFIFTGLLFSVALMEGFGATGIEGRGACIVTATAVFFLLLLLELPNVLQLLIPMLFWTVTVLFGLYGPEYPVRSVFQPDTRKWETVCRRENGRCFERFTSCAYFIPLLSFYRFDDGVGILIPTAAFGILFFIGTFRFLYRNGRTHRFADGWKLELYLFSLLHVFWMCYSLLDETSLNDITQIIITLSILVFCNSLAFYSGFRQKLSRPDATNSVAALLVRLIHTFLWIWGISLLHSGGIEEHPFLCTWVILLTLYLCGNGMREQYHAYRSKTGLGIYFGLRVTLYLLAVITAFDGIEGYLISCILLLLAIFAVLAGFPLRLAPLRIYGLCLAMFAVIKLLMIDVEHDNSMETVLCFLGAGILCFAINFIYNHVKKKFHDNLQ